jgi:putative hemolysin
MNKKLLLLIAIVVLFGLGAFLFFSFLPKEKKIIFKEDIDDVSIVSNIVEQFGKKLKLVSLQSPKEVLEKQIRENYEEFLSPELLAEWINDPSKALGRKSSSPWPERIDIKNIQRISQNKFLVEGEVIEITSVEAVEGGEANRFPIKLTLEKRDSKWAIVNIKQESNQIGIPNPASVYCEKQGGKLEIRNFKDGQKGFCIFDDGSECDEWEFYYGKCKKGEKLCKDLCGDGICQEIVCMAIGCPCPETKESCPIDCGGKTEIPCAKEGEKVNRNPLIGPTDQKCCEGLVEVRESRSYSVCKKAQKVLLYYYNPEKDKDENGNIKCSRDGLFPIERQIPVSQTPIKDTIELLLKGKENLTQKELAQGITTEFPLDGFKLKSINLKNDGTLILEFEDPLNKTVGGACRVGILWFQIEATAKQFPQVKKVQFLPEELFQP